MAKKAKGWSSYEFVKKNTTKKRTSIGLAWCSKPKNKHKKRNWKRYRGQGKYKKKRTV